MPKVLAVDRADLSTAEAEGGLGAVENLSVGLRERIAAQLPAGQGSADEIVERLAAGFGKKVTFKALKAEADSSNVDVEEPLAPATSNESLEMLNDVEKACLEAMKEDFDRGIVLIDPKDQDGNDLEMDKDAYKAALKSDKTAGQTWEAIQGRLLANKTALLQKAVELSGLTGGQEGKGALLVGVYKNGELAIRQRSQEIVNARWTKDWKNGQSDKGELRLLYHPDAVAQKTGRWANAVEILRAVKAAGFHVPADAPDYKKNGLVAASERVTGTNYVMSPSGDEWRSAMLECPDKVFNSAYVRVVNFDPAYQAARVKFCRARDRDLYRGAVLWLRG